MLRFNRITWNPNQMNGQPCIRGMRLTVRRVIEVLALYPNRDDFFRNYPELDADDLNQALAFAAANLEDAAIKTHFPGLGRPGDVKGTRELVSLADLHMILDSEAVGGYTGERRLAR